MLSASACERSGSASCTFVLPLAIGVSSRCVAGKNTVGLHTRQGMELCACAPVGSAPCMHCQAEAYWLGVSPVSSVISHHPAPSPVFVTVKRGDEDHLWLVTRSASSSPKALLFGSHGRHRHINSQRYTRTHTLSHSLSHASSNLHAATPNTSHGKHTRRRYFEWPHLQSNECTRLAAPARPGQASLVA